MVKKLCALVLLAALLVETGFASTKAVLTKDAKAYTQASTKSPVYCTLKKGDTVTVLATRNSAAKIQYDGKTLYMAKSALQKVDTAASPTSAPSAVRMTTQSDTKAYAAKSAAARSVSVKKGTVVAVYEIADGWYKIKKNGNWYYLPEDAFKVETSVSKKTTQKTNLYKNASTASKVLAKLNEGTILLIIDDNGSWLKVKKGSMTGYVSSSSFESVTAPTPTPAPETKTVQCKASVYKNSSSSSKVLGNVSAGTELTVLEEKDQWVKVLKGSSTGWISSSAFEPAAASSPTPSPAPKQTQVNADRNSEKVEKVIDAAMDKLGLPYVFGSTGPYSYDCSGLTLYAFRQVGITLAHSAYTQGYGASVRLTMDQLQRGDLVFFNTNKSDGDSCDHVGIYLGNGRFLHASSGKGRVIISELTSGYYAGVFSWGRKLL